LTDVWDEEVETGDSVIFLPIGVAWAIFGDCVLGVSIPSSVECAESEAGERGGLGGEKEAWSFLMRTPG